MLLGGGAREHAIGWALIKNATVKLFTVAHNNNPGLAGISADYLLKDESDLPAILDWARSKQIDLAIVGLEDPLAVGIVDALEAIGVPTVGPRRAAAKLEFSKSFTRDLMKRHGLPGQIEYRYFTNA